MRGPGGARAALGVAVLVGTLAAGCGSDNGGGGGGQSGGSGGGMTKAQLTQQANAICARHNAKITAAAQKMLAGGKLPTKKQFGKLAYGTIIPQTQAQVSELSALKPPAEVKAGYQQWLADQRSLVAGMKKDPRSIQSAKTFAKVNAEAGKLGFDKCHGGPS